MLPEFLTWWTRQMADLAAPLLKRLPSNAPDAMLLTPGVGGTLGVSVRHKGQIGILPGLPAAADPDQLRDMIARRRRREPVMIRLTRNPLVRDVWLPAAVEAGLDRFLTYEMDQLTPFKAADVFFAHRVLGVDRRKAAIHVEITLVPKVWVHALLDRLERAGIVPAALEVPAGLNVPAGGRTTDVMAPKGGMQCIPLRHADPTRRTRQRLAWRTAVAASGSLALATLAEPLVRQSMALGRVEAQVAELRPRVHEAEMLRQRIAAGLAGSGRIAAARQQAGQPLAILADLTDSLPDDTWLTSLSLRRTRLVLEGHSTAATRLIAALASGKRLHNPSFAAPVLRAETGGEVFTIQAEVTP